MVTEFTNEEYITNVRIYVSKNKTLIYMKQRLIEYLKTEIHIYSQKF